MLVDARPIAEFAAAHVPGSLSIQHRSVFASWFGWLVPLDRPVVFVLDEDTDRADLVRQCLAVGHDATCSASSTAASTPGRRRACPSRSIPLVTADHMAGTVLDIRQQNEWDAGHVPGAIHVELGDLATDRRPRRDR